MQLGFQAIRENVKYKYARRWGMRMIMAQLITRARDENVVLGWLEHAQRLRESEVREREQHRVRGRSTKWKMRRWIWSMWLGRESRE